MASKWTNPDGTTSKSYESNDRDGNTQSNIIRYDESDGTGNHDHSWLSGVTSNHGFRDDGFGTKDSHVSDTDYGVDKTVGGSGK